MDTSIDKISFKWYDLDCVNSLPGSLLNTDKLPKKMGQKPTDAV